MNIVLLRTEEPRVHVLEDRHLEQIRKVSGSISLQAPFVSDWKNVTEHLGEAEVLVGFPQEISRIGIIEIPHVRWIHSFSAGMDKVLTPDIKKSDILVSNSSGVHAIPIAEHVLGFMLLFAKKFPQSLRNQQQKQWQDLDGIKEIRDATLLIVGLGKIGKEIARVASGAGMRVSAVDRGGTEKPDFVQNLYKEEDLDIALAQADYVVLSLPHTEATHHLFGREKFCIMKKTAVFMNIGRGGLVQEEHLAQALQNKDIAGAALDVTEVEPLPEASPLWNMPNVVITPHHSSHTTQRMDRTITLFCSNIKAYIQKEKLPNEVDKQKGY